LAVLYPSIVDIKNVLGINYTFYIGYRFKADGRRKLGREAIWLVWFF